MEETAEEAAAAMTGIGSHLRGQASVDTISQVGSRLPNPAWTALQIFCEIIRCLLQFLLSNTSEGCTAGPEHPDFRLLHSHAILP